MVKPRLAVVLSPVIKTRYRLLTAVALSTTAPDPRMPYHCEVEIPFRLPWPWVQPKCWIKGDMVNTVAFHRVDLLCLGKDMSGKRVYQTEPLPEDLMRQVRRCVLHGMGLSTLTKHL